jgi:hypothetical protein
MNEYEKQAIDFAQKVGLQMTAIYTGHRARFGKHITAVYHVTLTRNHRSYSFDFSTSINDSWQHFKKPTKILSGFPLSIDIDKFFDSDVCRLEKFQHKVFVVRRAQKVPRLYDILAGITKSDPGTFSDFCGDFGYDEDSRKAFETYLAVQKEWEGVQLLFGDVLDELQEIN